MAFAKLKAFFANTTGRAMNNNTMKATCLGFAEMINADGKIEDDELEAAYGIFKRNPKLAVFGQAAVRELDTALDLWVESKRQARLTTNRALEAWVQTASVEDKEDFMGSILDLMESDGESHDAEQAVADKFFKLTGVDPKVFA